MLLFEYCPLAGRRGGTAASRRFRAAALALASVVVLAGCTIQPLYAPGPSGSSVATTLTHLVIDPVDDRVAQELRNRLIFTLYGGGGQPTTPVYRMHLTVTSSESALGVTPVESSPAYSVTVAATYEVTELDSGEIVLRATSRGTATYDRVNQVFANTRAKLDAENRAAVTAAAEIHTRLAAAAAKGTI